VIPAIFALVKGAALGREVAPMNDALATNVKFQGEQP
jgi:hypothetical protein